MAVDLNEFKPCTGVDERAAGDSMSVHSHFKCWTRGHPAKQIRTRDVLPVLLLCSKAGVKSVWLSFGRVSVSYHTTAQAGLLYIHEIWVRGENDSTIIHSKVVFSER